MSCPGETCDHLDGYGEVVVQVPPDWIEAVEE